MNYVNQLNQLKMKKFITLVMVAAATTFSMTSCGGGEEDANSTLENAVEEMGDAMNDMADEVNEAADDMTDAMVEDTTNMMEDTTGAATADTMDVEAEGTM